MADNDSDKMADPPESKDLQEPGAVDGEPIEEDEDFVEEPIDDEDDVVGGGRLGDEDDDTDSTGEANAFEDEDTPSPLP